MLFPALRFHVSHGAKVCHEEGVHGDALAQTQIQLDLWFWQLTALNRLTRQPPESWEFGFNLPSHLIMQSIDFNSILFSVRGCQVHYALFTLNHCKLDPAASGSTLIQNIRGENASDEGKLRNGDGEA